MDTTTTQMTIFVNFLLFMVLNGAEATVTVTK